MLGQAKCGLCGGVFRFDPRMPISMPIDGERQPACDTCRLFAGVWREAFGPLVEPAEAATPVTASEAPELPRRHVVVPSAWD